MEGYKLTIRLVALGLLTVLMVLVMGGRLVGLQIMSDAPAEVVSGKEKTYTHTVTLPAARGEILDRYGRPLVTNRFAYALTIDRSYLQTGGTPCETIYSLVARTRALKLSYADTLPVSAPPFRYTAMSPAVKGQLDHYFEKMQWDPETPAGGLMELLYLEYGMAVQDEKTDEVTFLYDWTPEEMRLVAGVMYEVEMRYQAGLAEQNKDKNVFQTYYHVPPYVFAEDIPMELIAYISENRLRGPQVITRNARVYETAAAAHMLGRIGPIWGEDAEYYKELGYSMDETVGTDGAEKAFEGWLHGTAGREVIETDQNGRVLSKAVTLPQAGNNVILTLDIRLQAEVERILEAGVARLNETGVHLKGLEAEAASAVILDVKTGEVLAAANYPTYNLAAFNEDYADLTEDPLKPMLNRAISGTYAPGSTFKMVTATAALQELLTPSNSISCRGIYTFYPDYQPRCWIYPGSHGGETVRTALRDSCNYYFYDTARQIGIEKLGSWAAFYGFGEKTGIELDGESAGFMAGPETSEKLGDLWTRGNTLQAAIGQQNSQFTPIQLANYTACIANGGTLYKTHLLREVVSYDYGRKHHVVSPEKLHGANAPEVAPENLAAVQEGMRLVVTQGTAHSVFQGFPIPVAGKTGTVQQVGERPNNGVFVAYAPYDDPQIAVALVVEKGGGGSIVAPLARDIIDAWVRLENDIAAAAPENSLKR